MDSANNISSLLILGGFLNDNKKKGQSKSRLLRAEISSAVFCINRLITFKYEMRARKTRKSSTRQKGGFTNLRALLALPEGAIYYI